MSRKLLLIAGLLSMMWLGVAHAQDMPDAGLGSLPDVTGLPGIPTTAGIQPQPIGGSTAGTVLFNPTVGLSEVGVVSDVGFSSQVTSSIDLTTEGALFSATSANGLSLPSRVSSWKPSGFNPRTSPQRTAVNSQKARQSITAAEYNQLATEFQSGSAPLSTQVPVRSGASGLSQSSGGAAAAGQLGAASSTTAHALGWSAALPEADSSVPDLTGTTPEATESSIQIPGADFVPSYTPRSRSTPEKSRRIRTHQVMTIREREAMRSAKTTRGPQRARPARIGDRNR